MLISLMENVSDLTTPLTVPDTYPCAGCRQHFAGDALAQGCCAHCWAKARHLQLHTAASYRLQGKAAAFVIEHHLPPTLAYSFQQLLEEAVEDALNVMAYPPRDYNDSPALYLRHGSDYYPIAPLNHYPAPGVWLVTWDERSRRTACLSRLPVPHPLYLAATYRHEDAALAEVRKRDAKTLGDVVRAVLDVIGNNPAEWRSELPRYTIDVGEKFDETLTNLAVSHEVTKAEIIRRAIATYSALKREVEAGYKVSITDPHDKVLKDMLLP